MKFTLLLGFCFYFLFSPQLIYGQEKAPEKYTIRLTVAPQASYFSPYEDNFTDDQKSRWSGYNFGVEARGLALNFGKGLHRVSIFDTLNNTLRNAVIIVSCGGKRMVKGRVLPNETSQYCLDFSNFI